MSESRIISINQLVYGQPTIEDKISINSGSVFSEHIKTFSNEHYPKNDTGVAKQEVYEVVSKIEKLIDDEWRSRCFFIDRQLGKYLNGYAQRAGLTNFKQIFDQVNDLYLKPLIFELKFHYNRIRPVGLAYYLNIALNPATTKTGHTPAYPSGHTLQTYFFTKMISDLTQTEWSDDPTREVASSRMSMGLHYKSDNDFAIKIAKYLTETKEYQELVVEIQRQLNNV